MAKHGYKVERGFWSAIGSDKREAQEIMNRMIDRAMSNEAPIVETRFGWLLLAVPTPTGWTSQLISPADMQQHARNHAANCFDTDRPRDRMVQSLRLSAAQCAWTQETDDEKHLDASGLDLEHENQLRSWLAFQRRYIAAKARGLSDNDAFDDARMAA